MMYSGFTPAHKMAAAAGSPPFSVIVVVADAVVVISGSVVAAEVLPPSVVNEVTDDEYVSSVEVKLAESDILVAFVSAEFLTAMLIICLGGVSRG